MTVRFALPRPPLCYEARRLVDDAPATPERCMKPFTRWIVEGASADAGKERASPPPTRR